MNRKASFLSGAIPELFNTAIIWFSKGTSRSGVLLLCAKGIDMFAIDGKKITLTRGDSAKITISIYDSVGNPYTPQTGDKVRFALKRNYTSEDVLIEKQIPTNTLELELQPSDTESLAFGSYVYDIELTYANGDVDTFISRGMLFLAQEVK